MRRAAWVWGWSCDDLAPGTYSPSTPRSYLLNRDDRKQGAFWGFGIPALAFSVLLVPLLIFMWKGYSLRRRHVAPPLDRTALPTTSLQLTPPTHRYAVIVGRRGPSCCAGLCCGAQRRPSEVLPREAAENPEAERVVQARRKLARRLARLPPLGLNFSSAEVRGVATEDDHSIVKEATSANGHYAGFMVFGAVSIWMIHGATSMAIGYMKAPASLDEEVPPPWCVRICESGEIRKSTLWLRAGTSAVTSAFRS